MSMSMRGIGTGPFDSAALTAVSLFLKSSTTIDLEKETNVHENPKKDLAHLSVELECKQALLQLNHSKETSQELSSSLQSPEIFERETYMYGCQDAKVGVIEMESRTNDMKDNKLTEYLLNMQEELSRIVDDTSASKEHVLILKRELELANQENVECLKQAQVAKLALTLEKVSEKEPLRNISKENETTTQLKQAANHVENGKEHVEPMQVEAGEGQEEIERISIQLETINELEAELLDKSLLIDSLQLELHRANDQLHSCAEKVAFDAICEANVLKAELELREVKSLDQACYINQLETELERLKLELIEANKDRNTLATSVEGMNEELEETRKRISCEDRNKESEAAIEIALLKSELHKGRSRLAAAAAAEERATVEKSAVYAALHHLAAEAFETKKENNRLKEAMATSEDSTDPTNLHRIATDTAGLHIESDLEGNNKGDLNVMISREEYEVLMMKNSELANHLQKMEQDYKAESEKLKKELEIATGKIAGLRSRAEQAISRAETAEKVKATLEERVKRWKEQRAKKKAALTTLHEESNSKEDSSLRYKNAPKVYHQPLGKILNMKF